MRNFHKLDETSLRAFYFAAESLSFTKAAENAGLTQSGISQHIAKLEESLNVGLFLRSRKRVQLTEAGRKLRLFVENYLDQVDSLLEDVRKETQEHKGTVRYAMPNSCLMTPHFPWLLKQRKKNFSGIDLKVTICHSHQVTEMLLSGEIDFGFVTSKSEHKDIEYWDFAQEEYALISLKKDDLNFKTIGELKGCNFVYYPGMDELFDRWQKHNFPRVKKLKVSDLKICGEINNLSGAITMVRHGVGLGLFPAHCVQELVKSGEVKCYETNNQKNSIYIVKVKDHKPTSRVQTVIDTFWSMA